MLTFFIVWGIVHLALVIGAYTAVLLTPFRAYWFSHIRCLALMTVLPAYVLFIAYIAKRGGFI